MGQEEDVRGIFDNLGMYAVVTKNKEIGSSRVKPDVIATDGKHWFVVQCSKKKSFSRDKFGADIHKAKKVTLEDVRKTDDIGAPEFGSVEYEDPKCLFVGGHIAREREAEERTEIGYDKKADAYIWDSDYQKYFSLLADNIGKWGVFELYDFFGIELNAEHITEHIKELMDVEVFENKYLPFLKVEEKRPINEKIFLFSAKPIDILPRAYVLRHKKPGAISETYQRLLEKKRLVDIAGYYSKEKCIPGSGESVQPTLSNPIIVALPEDARVEKKDGEYKLYLPLKARSICIIDGQHRLYSFAQPEAMGTSPAISKEVKESIRRLREELNILVVGLKPSEDEPIKKQARVFVDINQEQKKVKSSILLSVKWGLLNERSPQAMGYRVMELLDNKLSFKGLVKLTPLQRKPFKITSFILYAGLKSYLSIPKEGLFVKCYQGMCPRKFKKLKDDRKEEDYRDFIKFCVEGMNTYFLAVKKKFGTLWEDYGKYLNPATIGGFLRVLKYIIYLESGESNPEFQKSDVYHKYLGKIKSSREVDEKLLEYSGNRYSKLERLLIVHLLKNVKREKQQDLLTLLVKKNEVKYLAKLLRKLYRYREEDLAKDLFNTVKENNLDTAEKLTKHDLLIDQLGDRPWFKV